MKLTQTFKYHLYILLIFRRIFAVNQNIIQINYAYIIYELFQRFIDINLKNRKCVNKFKQHYLIFEVFVTRVKRCFSFVITFDANLMINIFEIKFCESFKFIKTI